MCWQPLSNQNIPHGSGALSHPTMRARRQRPQHAEPLSNSHAAYSHPFLFPAGLLLCPADMAGGKLMLGRSDLDFLMRPHAASGVIVMNLKGRVVPPAGGREYPVDCNLVFNVSGVLRMHAVWHVFSVNACGRLIE